MPTVDCEHHTVHARRGEEVEARRLVQQEDGFETQLRTFQSLKTYRMTNRGPRLCVDRLAETGDWRKASMCGVVDQLLRITHGIQHSGRVISFVRRRRRRLGGLIVSLRITLPPILRRVPS